MRSFALLVLLASSLPVPAAGVYDFERRELAPGVHLLVRPNVTREPVEPNALFIVNEADVVLFEAGGSPLAAENILAHIRAVTDKPVSMVINSHWHGDHNLGNQVWRREFPQARIVAHVETHAAMTGKPMAYVGRYQTMIPAYVADLEKRLAEGKLSERGQRMLPDIRVMAGEMLRTEVVAPDLLVDGGLVLKRGTREIHIKHLGKGNTPGDLVLWLPQERILATGDLLVHPLPYGFGSFPLEWLATLDAVARFDFVMLVPGHGEVQRDTTYLRTVQDMLRTARLQARAAVAKGMSLKDFQASLDLKQFAERLAGADADHQTKFSNWWVQPIARSAWLEARGEPIVQGASDETG